MNNNYSFDFEAYRFGRFVWVVLAASRRTNKEALYRCDIEGEVRRLEADDWESSKLLLFPVPFGSLPPVLRAKVRGMAQVELDGRATTGGAR